MKSLITWIYLPLVLIGGNSAAIYLVSENYPYIYLVLLVLFCISFSFLAERIAPYNKQFNKDHGDTKRDFAHAIVNELSGIVGWLLVPFIAGLITIKQMWPTDIHLAFQLILAILIADIGITLAHFASHKVNWMWKLHSIHHSVTRMYGFNGLMKHPIHQMIEVTAGVLPLLILGITAEVLALLIVAMIIQLLLQHSNVNYHSGTFEKVFAINKIHRFHHLNSAQEGNVNFGLFTSITDRLLGTFHFEEKRSFDTTSLGIENEPDFPKGYIAQLMYPFRKSLKSGQSINRLN